MIDLQIFFGRGIVTGIGGWNTAGSGRNAVAARMVCHFQCVCVLFRILMMMVLEKMMQVMIHNRRRRRRNKRLLLKEVIARMAVIALTWNRCTATLLGRLQFEAFEGMPRSFFLFVVLVVVAVVL